MSARTSASRGVQGTELCDMLLSSNESSLAGILFRAAQGDETRRRLVKRKAKVEPES